MPDRIDDMFVKYSVLNVGISAIGIEDARSFIEDAISGARKSYICTCPVSTIMACKRQPMVMRSVNSSDLATPDGMPVVWIGRLLGHKNVKRVYGPDLMRCVCGSSREKGYRHFFYGSSERVLNRLKENLAVNYPGLTISGMHSPPFRRLTEKEDSEEVNKINAAYPDIVWVGLGSPKQDMWMYKHRGRINAPVMIGVGAAFDFLAGTKPQAPRWMKNAGLEWFFRLMTEPRRLWRRYLVDNPLFVYYLIIEIISKTLKQKKCRTGIR